MIPQPELANGSDTMHSVFEHSITWEDDIWRADPVDVEEVHATARRKFTDVLTAISDGHGPGKQARILLFHGQSGAGKTHLIRALRTGAHRQAKAYFGYAQMSADVANYADYYLRRLIASLEKPYDPDEGGDGALARLTNRLVEDADVVAPADLEELREADLDNEALARLVMRIADDVLSSPAYADQDLDVNIVRALLYMQRCDPRIDSRVRQYLYGRQLNSLSQEAVLALDPNEGEGRAFEIIESLGRLMWTADHAALVFCIDQVEDLRFFDDPHERFQKAVRDLIQIANLVPSSIILISCLGDFYSGARSDLAQSYVDRIEKSGPVQLGETRTADEARMIIDKRLGCELYRGEGEFERDPERLFGAAYGEEFAGLSTRRLLEHAQARLTEQDGGDDTDHAGLANGEHGAADNGEIVSALAAALAQQDVPDIDFRMAWEDYVRDSEAEIPTDEQELIDILVSALDLASIELAGSCAVSAHNLDDVADLAAADVNVAGKSSAPEDLRVFICNKTTQGGALKRQLDRVLEVARGHNSVLLRASNFPPNRKNQTAQAYRRFLADGGRGLVVPIHEWERMMMVRGFHARHGSSPNFSTWLQSAKLLTVLPALTQLLRLDRGNSETATAKPAAREPAQQRQGAGVDHEGGVGIVEAEQEHVQTTPPVEGLLGMGESAFGSGPAADIFTGWPSDDAIWADRTVATGAASPVEVAEEGQVDGADSVDAELPLDIPQDVFLNSPDRLYAGASLSTNQAPIVLTKDLLKRHAAVLGGSGSGKTTLALSLIEQLLMSGTPVVLLDRKGDLCSYANPDVWRANEEEDVDVRAAREKLGDSIDVAVYTPGRASGRPISITLLPDGIGELPAHEQQLLANLSAAALGDMLHLKNSATHQKQSGVLAVALRILGARATTQVALNDLIYLLEDEDPELADHTMRMDPSGKIRRDLVAQLDSLRHRNAVMFDGSGEPMRMDALLGLGPYARPGRTRLSIIYTGFLGDNENILFWVSQFLSETLRFCQRNPNDSLQAMVMFDEADLYIPANAKPATAEPLQSLLKRARSAGLGLMLATQSPGDLDYKSRDQITSWFIGRVREDTALRKLRAAFQSESGLDPASVLPGQTVGEFHLVQEGNVRPMKAQRSMITAEQVPFDRIEQLARETKGQDEQQLGLFDAGGKSAAR